MQVSMEADHDEGMTWEEREIFMARIERQRQMWQMEGYADFRKDVLKSMTGFGTDLDSG